MKATFHPEYVHRLLQNEDILGLHRLFIALGIDRQLPDSCLIFSSVLTWISATRSGAWTYYEATSPTKQQALLDSLTNHQTLKFLAEQYQFGMENWQTENALNDLDRRLDQNEKRIHQLLIEAVKEDEETLVRLASE